MSDGPRTAIGYTRLSQTSQISIDNQKEYIEYYFDVPEVDLLTIYDDGEMMSGWDYEGRTEYHSLVDRVNGQTTHIIGAVDKKRFARDFDDTMQLVINCRKNNVEMHVTGPGDKQYPAGKVDLDDPIKAAVELLLSAAAEKDKRDEIERAVKTIQQKTDAGHPHGAPPTGLAYSKDKMSLEPSEENGWNDVVEVLSLRKQGHSYRQIEAKTGVPKSTVADIVDREETYANAAERVGWA